jgi:hypothetical protein
MQPVEHYLKKLLLDYDCVTIPGLGGFIMQSQPAWINQGANKIFPPSRKPSFNILLSHDDGLLISSISRTEQISYQEAGSFVNDFVTGVKNQLAAENKFSLEDIGEFVVTPENMTLFRQAGEVNFLSGAFGMEPINLYTVVRPQPVARATRKPVDRKFRADRDRKPAHIKWTLILSVPVIIFLLYGIMFPRSFQNAYTNYSGLITDIFPSQRLSVPSAPTVNTSSPVIAETETNAKAESEIVTTPQKEEPTMITEVNLAEEVLTRYYIIGGCFENGENAVKFLGELLGRGFPAEKAGATKRGHIRISYKSFIDKTDALSYLDEIRHSENAAAWLLKY